MSKDFFKLFSPVDEKLVNAGTSDGNKKGWETRKGNRIGGSGVDAEYPKNPHDFSKSNLSSDYHKVAGSAAALSSLAQNSGRSINHELAKGEHLKASRLAALDKNEEQADYHRNMADKHGEQAKATAEPKSPDTGVHPNTPHISGDGWGFGRGLSNADSSIQDRLLNSALTGGAKITVGQLATGLTEALGDKLKNSSIQDILCPDESGHWACVLDNSKVFFTLKDGQPLLNWEHKEKKEKDYPDWEEEPKVDGAWDEDLIGGGDGEILNANPHPTGYPNQRKGVCPEATVSQNSMGNIHAWQGHVDVNTSNPRNHKDSDGNESKAYFQDSGDIDAVKSSLHPAERKELEKGYPIHTTNLPEEYLQQDMV